ncbi:MAG: ABC transporter ATP-binding protein [Actinobacteria bacterium]|nr:ABC transporter ATP-binding protein [Actinomycetota bacterium]
MIRAEEIGIRFTFDRHRRVVTPNTARFRSGTSTNWGIRGVSFSARGGEGIGLIGRSGSGKTTMLRILAGVYVPDEGRLQVRGPVASLLAIDAGLLSLLTGRENALLLGVLGGLSRRQSKRALDAVKDRSGLGEAFEYPVSAYSQGMRARLGFAVAEEVEPRILLLDEVHEALDHEFRSIVQERAHALLAAGGVVVATGHDHPLLEQLCSRAIYLDNGSIVADGPFREVQGAYLEDVRSGTHR